MMPRDQRLEKLTVEKGLVLGFFASLLGAAMIGWIVFCWWRTGFGELDYPVTMRWVVPGVGLVALGFQTAMASLMGGVLRMHHSRQKNRMDVES